MAKIEPLTSSMSVDRFSPGSDRLFHSATHEEILSGATTDIYFVKSYDLLRHLGLLDTEVVAEIFASRAGMACGIEECLNLLRTTRVQVWAVKEGYRFQEKEVIFRIKGAYSQFGLYETCLLGMLASASAWATASSECKEACQDKDFLCFGARHVHPAVAPVMERAAVIGGARGASCILGAKLLGLRPSGTIPHAVIIIAGDTVRVARAYDEVMDEASPRIVLVDTFKDEAEESLRVAEALKTRLQGIRLDTPGERGGVTPPLVGEVRARLDQAGYKNVKIFVSGGLTPERISILSNAGADAFGVGSYISGARPIDMTMDIKEVKGLPIAKRGRIPGITSNPSLEKRL
jgi:nicotinate phosphoribosyltransferase